MGSATKPSYPLTPNQQRFVRDAEDQGFDVDYGYSGRFMYGQTCPAVRVDSVGEFGTKAATRWDNMGLGFVVYAPASLRLPAAAAEDEDDEDEEDG